MVLKIFCMITLFSGLLTTVSAQQIDNTASFRMMTGNRYVRLHYENDYFSNNDKYYTQGVNFEIVNPAYRSFIINKILVSPKNTTHLYGISLEHNGYTPTSIHNNNILYGDRPYAAAVFLKTFSTSSDTIHHWRITSSLSTGVIGPAAGGKQIQQTIHRWIKDEAPLGWQNQIQNDLILNYETGFEMNLVHYKKYLIINTLANARAGTLNTKLTTGLIIMAGKLNQAITSVFSTGQSPTRKSKTNVHVYAEPLINLVGYDATLQGGLFDHRSPYTLSNNNMERFTFQTNTGIVFQYRAVYAEYFQSYITKEFKTGMIHHWGGIRIGVNF